MTKGLDEGNSYPGFKEFSDFVAEEARIACNPVSSLYALKHVDEKAGKEQKCPKANALVTTTKVPQKENSTPKNSCSSEAFTANSSVMQTKMSIECVCFQTNHFIYKFEKAAAMPLEEKRNCPQ